MWEELAEGGRAFHIHPLEGRQGGTCETFHGTVCSR